MLSPCRFATLSSHHRARPVIPYHGARLASLEVVPQILVPTLHQDALHQTSGEDQAVHHVLRGPAWPGGVSSFPMISMGDLQLMFMKSAGNHQTSSKQETKMMIS